MNENAMTSKTNSLYCDICGEITRHIRLSSHELGREIDDTTSERFWTEVNQFNPLVKVVSGVGRLFGAIDHHKCTKCGGYIESVGDKEHGFYLNEKWWNLQDLKNDDQLLKKIRKKYNPNLLKK